MDNLFYTGVIGGKMILNTEVTVLKDSVFSDEIAVEILGQSHDNIKFYIFNIHKIPFPPEFYRRAANFNTHPTVEKVKDIALYLIDKVGVSEEDLVCGGGDGRIYNKLLKSVCGLTGCGRCPIQEENLSKIHEKVLTDEQRAAIFMMFLEINDCSSRFINNFDKQKDTGVTIGRFLRKNSINSYISNAFTWNGTPEGYDFWSDLSGKWKKFKKTA